MANAKKMKYRNIIVFVIIFIVFGLITAQDHVKGFMSSYFNDPGTNKLKETVAEVIMDNPELILKSLQEFQLKKEKEHADKIKTALSNQKDELQKTEIIPVAGNEDADVNIQYFFDYNCGYCKRVNQTIKELLHKDKNVRVHYNSMPILGSNSERLAKISYAIYLTDKNKFIEFHDKVMELPHVREEDFSKIISQINLDPSKVMYMADSPAVNDYFEKIRAMAIKLEINGSPVFIINNKDIIKGAIDLKSFEDRIAALRTEQAKK